MFGTVTPLDKERHKTHLFFLDSIAFFIDISPVFPYTIL